MDVTAESLDAPISAQSIVKSAKSNLKVPEGFASEHILISSDDTDSADEPTVVGKQFSLSNRVRLAFIAASLKCHAVRQLERMKSLAIRILNLLKKLRAVAKDAVTDVQWGISLYRHLAIRPVLYYTSVHCHALRTKRMFIAINASRVPT